MLQNESWTHISSPFYYLAQLQAKLHDLHQTVDCLNVRWTSHGGGGHVLPLCPTPDFKTKSVILQQQDNSFVAMRSAMCMLRLRNSQYLFLFFWGGWQTSKQKAKQKPLHPLRMLIIHLALNMNTVADLCITSVGWLSVHYNRDVMLQLGEENSL